VREEKCCEPEGAQGERKLLAHGAQFMEVRMLRRERSIQIRSVLSLWIVARPSRSVMGRFGVASPCIVASILWTVALVATTQPNSSKAYDLLML
jgi:hypothetical protein